MEQNRNIGQKLVKAAAERLAPHGGTESHRPDLYLADHQTVTKSSSRIMLGWASGLEKPSSESIENWVMANIQGTKMELATLKWHPHEHVATMVVSWMLPTRRLADADKMLRVAPGKFMEGGTKTVWEVRESDGEKFLVRLVKDNLDELLTEKKKKAAARGKMPSFLSVKSAGTLELTSGDQVRYYYNGQVKLGRVVRKESGQWLMESGKDRNLVNAAAAVEVVTKDPSTVADHSKRVMDYYKKIFPADYIRRWKAVAK